MTAGEQRAGPGRLIGVDADAVAVLFVAGRGEEPTAAKAGRGGAVERLGGEVEKARVAADTLGDVVQTVPGTDAGLGQAGEFWQTERGQAGTEQVTSAFPTWVRPDWISRRSNPFNFATKLAKYEKKCHFG